MRLSSQEESKQQSAFRAPQIEISEEEWKKMTEEFKELDRALKELDKALIEAKIEMISNIRATVERLNVAPIDSLREVLACIKLTPHAYPPDISANTVLRDIKSSVIRHLKEYLKEKRESHEEVIMKRLFEFASGTYDVLLKELYYGFFERLGLPDEDFEKAIEWILLHYIKDEHPDPNRLPPTCLAVLAFLTPIILGKCLSSASMLFLLSFNLRSPILNWYNTSPQTPECKIAGWLHRVLGSSTNITGSLFVDTPNLRYPVSPMAVMSEALAPTGFKMLSLIRHLGYIEELSLAYWDGDKWQITELGELLLRIPPKHLPEALLYLETKLSKGTLLCMNKSFVETLYELSKERIEIKIYELVDKTKLEYGLIRAWLIRMDALGLLTYDRIQGKVQMKRQSPHILRKVIEEESPLFAVISSLIQSTDPPMVVREDVAINYLRRNMNHPLLKGLTDELEQALKTYETDNYMTALRALLPIIEKIVREIYVREKIGGTGDSLNTMVEKLTEKRFISEGVKGLIISLRRNEVAHGLWPPSIDDARIYSHLALITIPELIRDYERHKFLRKVLNEINKLKDYTLNVDELLKSYPYNRKTLHVEWITDDRLRVTLRGEVYEAIRKDNRPSVKRVK